MSAITSSPFAGTFEADVHSTVAFAVRHMGISTFRGSFGELEARLVAGDGGVRLEGAVAVDSISIGDPPDFRAHVVDGTDFLDAGTHPAIRFVSRRVELRPGGGVTVEGELALAGRTHELAAHGTYEGPIVDPFGAERAALELRTTIDRRHWGMTWQAPLPSGGDALGWHVDVSVHLELVRQA